MPTDDQVRENRHPRPKPRFFEDWSQDDRETFLRSLRRNEQLYSIPTFRLPLRVWFLSLLNDRLTYMTVASVIGVFLFRLGGGSRQHSQVLLALVLGLTVVGVVFRTWTISRFSYSEALQKMKDSEQLGEF
jgi:hypothetical protein